MPLGTTASYSVLAGQGVTNTGPSVISHDLGTHPNPAITGFPPGLVLGAVHAADAAALQAKSDLTIAYNNAAGQAQDFALAAAIGAGQTLLPGVHTATSGVGLTGDLILDAGGNPNAVWVFQIPEALTTASSSRILLTNGASACNVYWQIGSSATLGTDSTFVGTIMALTSIFVTTRANIEGRALARNGQVTLDTNRIFLGTCATGGTTGTTTTGTTTGATTGTTTSGATSGVLGGVLGGVTTGGGLLGGPIGSGVTGGTSGNISGNTSGNVAGNTTGASTSGNTTVGNTTGGSITGGNVTGGNGGKPGHQHGGKPGHEQGGKPGHEQGEGPGGPDHEHGEKPGKPDHGEHYDHDHGQDQDHEHGRGQDHEHDYGYGNKPMSNEG